MTGGIIERAIARYGEPVKISPLIRFSRYAALFLGITYGSLRQSYLQRRANRLKDIREKKIADRLSKEKIQKAADTRAELKYLEDITGAKFT